MAHCVKGYILFHFDVVPEASIEMSITYLLDDL